VRFVIRRDARGLFLFAARQGAAGAALLRQPGLDPGGVHTLLPIRDGEAHLRSDAMLEIAGDLGPGWKPLLLLRVVPRVWHDALYDVIARHRYRWLGR